MKKALIILIIITFYSLHMLTYADLSLSTTPVFQKGMCYVTWTKDKYMSPYSVESLSAMKEAGVEWISIVVTWYQKEHNSTKIFRTGKTPSDRSIRYVINRAHEMGLKVMLKPHIDLINQADTLWRADIGFGKESDWERWFKGYRKFITHYAKIAEKTGVEIFCVGTELIFTTTEKPDMWKNEIIPGVRNVYSGPIIYAANWQDEFEKIEFWQELDYAGLDAYFPLSRKAKPSLEEIRRAWAKWLVKIEKWQKRIGKPVIFTEIGYCSARGAASKPWEVAMKGDVDLEVQADCYRALLETVWHRPWFYGMYWWKWNVNNRSGGQTHRRFTPQNKPAQKVMTEWYKERENDIKRENNLEKIELVRYTY